MKVLKAERLIRREVLDVLKGFNATDIESYTLLSNYGYTFKINGIELDARFWENMYGTSPERWYVNQTEDYKEELKELTKTIEDELNKEHYGSEYLDARFQKQEG